MPTKPFPLIVSFYTKDTPYEFEINNLKNSCRDFDLPYKIEGIDSFGSWELNCAYKPFFLLKILQEVNQPILWVDADGMFLKKPAYLDHIFCADFSVRINPELGMDHHSKVISSTMFVNNSESAKRLLKAWIKQTHKSLTREKERTFEFWDQVALRDVLWSSEHEADVRPLPIEYATIFDSDADKEKAGGNIVIEQYQASRRMKVRI